MSRDRPPSAMPNRAAEDPLAARYGRARTGPSRVVIALAALIASAFLGWVAWATLFHATPKIASEMISFDIVNEHEAVARFGVKRSDDSVVGTCTLQAIAEDHTTVGQLAFQVPEGPAPLKQTLTQSLRTERLAVSVDLLGCTADGQPRPR